MKEKGIGLDYSPTQETFYVIKNGKFIVSFRYGLIDAYADILSERNDSDSIIVKLLESTSQIYGVDNFCIYELNKVFKEYREKILSELPPALQEELEQTRYAQMIDERDREIETNTPSWKDGKTPEEIEKIEKKFAQLEEEAKNEANFKKEDGKLVYVAKNTDEDETTSDVEGEKEVES